jgi:hypothetical protein
VSATRGTSSDKRDPLDRYYTPAAWCDHVIARWGTALHRLQLVLEPSVGRGDWSTALRRAGFKGRIVGVDLDPDAAGEGCDEVIRGDWMEIGPALLEREPVDLILGNPPYRHLHEHVRTFLASSAAVSLTVRTCWLQSARFQELRDVRWPPSVLLSAGRPSFDSPGVNRRGATDSTDYSQVSWQRPGRCAASLDWMRWKPRRGDP